MFLGAKAPLGLAMGVTVSVTVSHEKVSKLQDLARTSYIRYLPTIICKDLLVLLSPFNNCISTSVPPYQRIILVLLAPPIKEFC